jgi:hypothetical protein
MGLPWCLKAPFQSKNPWNNQKNTLEKQENITMYFSPMSIKPHPTKLGEGIIDCRPNGYKGKRERFPFTGTEEQARTWERRMMRRHIDISTPTARSLSGIYPIWEASFRIERAARTVEDAANSYQKVHIAILEINRGGVHIS